MKVNIALLCLLIGMFGSTIAAEAQVAGAPVDITLDEAISRGLAASHRVEGMAAQRDSAAAVEGQNAATRYPQLTASAGYTRTNHVDEFGLPVPAGPLRVIYPDVPDNFRTRLDVRWDVYTAGRRGALGEAAHIDVLASDADMNALRTDLRLDNTRAFWALVIAEESKTVVDESLTRVGEHLRDVRNRLDTGLVPPNDVSTTEARQAHEQMLSIQAGTRRDNAEAALVRLVGLPPGTRLQPVASLASQTVEGDLAALIARAQAERADRRALAERVSAAGARREAAAATARPTVAVGGGIDYANPNPRIFPRRGEWDTSWDASINVMWPVFDGGRREAVVAQADASKRALEARARELDDLVALEIRQRLAEVESSQAAIDAAEAAVRAATEARRVVEDRFAAGVATNTDVLDAQGAVLQARLDRTEALANAQVAAARLQHALGQ
jgi:outer membrane protein TolC